MPDALDGWGEKIVALSVILTAVAYIARRWLWPTLAAAIRLVRGTAQLVEDYRATGGFTGLHAQGVALASEVKEVKQLAQQSHHELHPNGGSSMRDTVDRVEDKVSDLREDAARLEGYAAENREGIADVNRRVTDLDEKVERVDEKVGEQGERITEHRRRNDETIDRLQEYLEGERNDLIVKAQGLEASVHELLMYDGPAQHDDDRADHQPDLS